MATYARVVEDSVSSSGKRITTLQIKFPRFCLPEFNTHRVFSRNFSSSRAIPTKKLLEQVRTDPAMPVHWGKNQPGMQASEELGDLQKRAMRETWIAAAHEAANRAELMAQIGAHKQIVNRIIEPFMWATGIVTSTEWANWDELRRHEDAQPEIYQLACRIHEAMAESTPRVLAPGEWHLPYVSQEERDDEKLQGLLQQISAARCCRVSYLKHDGTVPSVDDDLALFQRLAGATPLHASPLEHQATPDVIVPDSGNQMAHWKDATAHGNFQGWIQYRKLWEREIYKQ